MNHSLKTLFVIAVLIAIVWNLGAGLYYMLVDKGGSRRTVNALTRRIVLSVGLILAIIFAAWMGWIDFHSVGSNPPR
ncbi:twin transmembrane helix small protein [Cognatilysobacter lacus]|uniref:Twin transmembrane helix small protein n=1 Tax=Cognatilysobacter lacus TaxID=1643323 RepID=A0A5D8ZAR2_9GAMM|nr:twin transmembrane helix small protein [Lysobacter lacus]TZF89764.1 twin transmembrane helix small protein [Lysobacter lacus]